MSALGKSEVEGQREGGFYGMPVLRGGREAGRGED